MNIFAGMVKRDEHDAMALLWSAIAAGLYGASLGEKDFPHWLGRSRRLLLENLGLQRFLSLSSWPPAIIY